MPPATPLPLAVLRRQRPFLYLWCLNLILIKWLSGFGCRNNPEWADCTTTGRSGIITALELPENATRYQAIAVDGRRLDVTNLAARILNAKGKEKDITAPSNSSSARVDSNQMSGLSTGAKAGIGIGISLSVMFASLVVFLLFRKRRRANIAENKSAAGGADTAEGARTIAGVDGDSQFGKVELDASAISKSQNFTKAELDGGMLGALIPTTSNNLISELPGDMIQRLEMPSSKIPQKPLFTQPSVQESIRRKPLNNSS